MVQELQAQHAINTPILQSIGIDLNLDLKGNLILEHKTQDKSNNHLHVHVQHKKSIMNVHSHYPQQKKSSITTKLRDTIICSWVSSHPLTLTYQDTLFMIRFLTMIQKYRLVAECMVHYLKTILRIRDPSTWISFLQSHLQYMYINWVLNGRTGDNGWMMSYTQLTDKY